MQRESNTFEVISTERIEEIKISATHLKHTQSQAEILHLATESGSENFFGILLKTYPSDDTGVAHILDAARPQGLTPTLQRDRGRRSKRACRAVRSGRDRRRDPGRDPTCPRHTPWAAPPRRAPWSAGRAARPGPWTRDAAGPAGCCGSSRSVSVESSRLLTSGTSITPRSASAGTSRSVLARVATTSAVRGLPVRAAISPKKSPGPHRGQAAVAAVLLGDAGRRLALEDEVRRRWPCRPW